MTSGNYLKFYWGTIIRDLLKSVCSYCSGEGCDHCHQSGRRPFTVENDGEYYAIPLWIMNKKGLHEFLKSVIPSFPANSNGKPMSLSPNAQDRPEIGQIMDFFKEIEMMATYSGIELHIKAFDG